MYLCIIVSELITYKFHPFTNSCTSMKISLRINSVFALFSAQCALSFKNSRLKLYSN